jgi:glycosyltransferase involved in cell wall biosynthesis
MRVSIVTISFNQAKFLETTINSVLQQHCDELEYIVVDPGSTDGSREIIKKHSSRISKLVLEPDNGPASGLNKGFSFATGEIFGFLNADDILEPSTISRVTKYFIEHPEVDVISGHSFIINADGDVKRRFFSDHYSLRMAAYGAAILSQPSTFFRANFFRQVGGFNIQNRSNWDGELFADMALSGAQFALVSEFWSRYRVHGEGITGSGKLHTLHKLHSDRMFKKIVGRDARLVDRVLAFGARFLRKILNPMDTFERVRYGSIYQSTV